MRMILATCASGLDLMRGGRVFWAWEPGAYYGLVEDDTEYLIEVPEGAYKVEEAVAQYTEESGPFTINEYTILKPELVKRVSEIY